MPTLKLELDDELYQALAEEALAIKVDIEEIAEAILTEALFELEEPTAVDAEEADEAHLDEGGEV